MQKDRPDLRRRTFFTPLLMPVLAGITALLVLGWLYTSMTMTTVFLVRHAEKISEPGSDPGLTVDGQARAADLAQMLGQTAIAGLYASEFQRTQLTLQPLAEALGLEVTIVPASEPERLVAEILSEHRGGTVIIAGHSNTLPELIEMLSGVEAEPIDESDYRGIYVLSLPRFGEHRLTRLRYPH